jgi:hypothetical protein
VRTCERPYSPNSLLPTTCARQGFRKLELEVVVGHPRPCRAAHPVNGEIASAEAGHCHRHRHDTERLARPSAGEDVGALAARGMLGAAG